MLVRSAPSTPIKISGVKMQKSMYLVLFLRLEIQTLAPYPDTNRVVGLICQKNMILTIHCYHFLLAIARASGRQWQSWK